MGLNLTEVENKKKGILTMTRYKGMSAIPLYEKILADAIKAGTPLLVIDPKNEFPFNKKNPSAHIKWNRN